MKTFTFFFLSLLLVSKSLSQEASWVTASSHQKSEGQKVIEYNGDIYTLGCYSDSLSFPTPTGTFNRFYPLGSHLQTSYFAKFDSNKNLVWCHDLPFINKFRHGLYGGNMQIPPYLDFIIQNNSIYFSGNVGDTSDLTNNTSLSQISGYGKYHIAKFDLNMNLNWKISLGDTFDLMTIKIIADANDNIYCLGTFRDSVDFDPSANNFHLVPDTIGQYKTFIASYDANGNFRWAQKYNISCDLVNYKKYSFELNDNKLYLSSFVLYPIDLDPTAGIYNYTDIDKHIIVSYSTSDGNLKKVLSLAPINPNGVFLLQNFLPKADKIFFGGHMQSANHGDTLYFDYPNTSWPLIQNDNDDAVLGCMDTIGNILWVKNLQSIGGGPEMEVHDIDIYNNAVIFSGEMNYENIDFDPSSSISISTSTSYQDYFMTTYDFSGNYLWHHTISANGWGGICDLFVNESQNKILSTGFFSGYSDFDCDTITNPLYSGHTAIPSAFIIEYNVDSCSFLNAQMNSITPITCTQQGNASINIIGGVLPYSILWNINPVVTGSTTATIDTAGVYSVLITDAAGCIEEKFFFIDGPNSYTDIDLSSYLVTTGYVPGEIMNFSVIGKNESCVPVNGTLEAVLDPQVNFITASFPPSQIAGDTLRWNFSNLIEDSLINIVVTYSTNTMAQIGDTITMQSNIYPYANDIDTSNNQFTIVGSVVASYDPNEIVVHPVGECEEHFTLLSEKLTYTIHFQNTGNSNAINITIIDTLNQFLDINTFNVIANSHSMITEFIDDHVLSFHFPGIQLPDSNTNVELSQGFIVYEINALPTTPIYTVIENRANIFFDYNLPVMTNTVFNTLVNSIVNCNLSIEKINENLDISIYPNPGHDHFSIQINDNSLIKTVELLNLQGQIIQSFSVKNKLATVDIGNLSNGLYFIRVYSGNGNSVYKLVKE